MSFERAALAEAVARHGTVARVVVAEAKGSTPRDPGAAMLVWDSGQSGTIGGGALEFTAASAARGRLQPGQHWITRQALGPGLNQCCGGAVVLVTEIYDAAALADLPDGPVVRRIEGTGDMPLSMRADLRRARGEGVPPAVRLCDGWLIEPDAPQQRPLWIFGAGHVGRALVNMLAPLPDIAITWVDTGPDRFPDTMPDGVTILPAVDPVLTLPHAPEDAEFLILTYSHTLDLALCHGLLTRGFRRAGLIGSATKWARFRTRLGQLGHTDAEIRRIACPIGNPTLGKHPQAIAIGVATALLSEDRAAGELQRGRTG